MKQEERRIWLIRELLKEQSQYHDIEIPQTEKEQKRLLRALFNVRPPMTASNEFLQIQDEYLLQEAKEKGIMKANELPVTEADERLVLWQGDITRLEVGAIVNAANSGMTGCYQPNHTSVSILMREYSFALPVDS